MAKDATSNVQEKKIKSYKLYVPEYKDLYSKRK